MTLNTASGIPPSPHLHSSPHNLEAVSTRRRNTVGSPTSAVFKPAIALSQVPAVTQQSYLPLPPAQQAHLYVGEQAATGPNVRHRSKSPSQYTQAALPLRARHTSRSPDRGTAPGGGGWVGYGRRNDRQHHLAPKSGPLNMQGKRNDAQQPITGLRPAFKHSPQSMSLPSTPNHLPRHPNGVSRSPSPPACMLDSPRSATSEPVFTAPYYKAPSTGCGYETLLVDARRRIPYSLGIDKLKPEKPRLERLPQFQEEELTKEMKKEYERLKPSPGSEKRRREFLYKLSRILNEEWPGYDTRVHAFGSTENHLCMEDSDVDVCITTKCKEIESTCKLATALAKHGMSRIVCVPGAKVPIVKIWDPVLEIACDMNVNSTLALDNTRMIKTYVEIDERVRPLALIIKHWTKQRVLNNAAIGGTLSSYTWICMILSFLQTRTPPLLPSLHKIPHEPKPPNQGVDVSFADDIEKLRGWGKDNTETLGELLFAFFKKYGHDLDYEKTVISVREGTLLSKEEKGWQYLQNNRLCVEEPFNTSRNLGNTADDCSMRGIHMEFRKAHKILAEKASLADVCETYEFPPEETHHVLPPQAPSRPVTLSRSNSNHGRNRNGYAAGTQRGGRGYQFNNNRNPQNRRGSSGAAAFNQNVAQHQYYSPDILGYAQLSHDQLVAFQAQIQAHAVAQSQLAHLAQIQLHNQQNGTQSAPTGATSNEINSFLPTWPYFANLYNFSVFYPGFHNAIGSESSNIPTSPSHTSAAMADGRSNRDNDGSRTGLGRGNGRRTTAYTNGSRSHSQPPSLYPNNDYSQNMPVVGVPGSEDDGFGDHSSNGNPPTPPEEELDEYEGYYLLGGPLQPDLAVVDPPVGVEEEPFLEQKTVVDRQKRFSHEKLPPPMLGLARDTSCRDEVHQASPVIVNGSIPQTPYANSNSSGVPNGADSTTSRDSGSYTTAPEQRRQKYPRNAQKLLEVHNNQASRSEGSSSLPHHQQHSVSTSSPVPPPISSPSSSSETASECGSDNSPRLSPDLRQRAASRQLLWTNARTPLDAVKSRAHSSQEDLSIIPATEAPTPRKAPKPHANTHTKKEDKSATVASPRSNASREDPVPPTPAVEKKNGGGGRSKGNGGKPAGANTQQQQKNKDAKVEQKAPGDSTKNSQWISKRKTKKKKSHPNTKETAAAASVGKESERKGG